MFEKPGKNKNVMKSAILIELLAIIVLVLLLLYQCSGKKTSGIKAFGKKNDGAVITLSPEALGEDSAGTFAEDADAAGENVTQENVVVVEKIVEKVVEKVVEKPVYVEKSKADEKKINENKAVVNNAAVNNTDEKNAEVNKIAINNHEIENKIAANSDAKEDFAEEEKNLNSFFDSFTNEEENGGNDEMLESAIKISRQILEKDPTNDKAYYFVSVDEIKKKNYELALEALQHAIEYNDINYLYYYDYGKIFFVRKDFVTAANQFKRSIELNDKFHPSWYNLGLTYIKLGLLEPALDSFKNSVEVKPDYEKGWLETARTYNRLKDSENAINAYKKVIEINGRNLQPVMELGSLYFEECRFVEAEEMYKAALENLNKGEEETLTKYNLSIVLIEDKKYEEARTYAWAAYEEKEFISSDSVKANVIYNYALVMELLGNIESAVDLYKETLSYNPEHVKAKINLANQLANSCFLDGDYEKAKEYYLSLIDLDKENWGAYLNVAKCFIQLEDNENALRYLAYLNSKAPEFKSEEVENLLNTLL
ncbi:MAG: tetratricopeptide repeat protein [Treponema sp.]|nr:tetratricopeptide repeat protein [Treponema sp.]